MGGDWLGEAARVCPLGIEGYWQHVSEGIATFTADLANWEGNVDHMYLDTVGFVTVGKGKRLPDADSAAALPFLHDGTETPASEAEIREEYELIAGMREHIGQFASFFDPFTNLYLSQSEIDRAAEPVYAVRSAMYFWLENGLLELADVGLTEAATDRITRRINPGTSEESREDRREFMRNIRDGGQFDNICRFSVARPRFEDAE